MKIKTAELTGAALDWAVAKCEGMYLGDQGEGQIGYYDKEGRALAGTDWWRPSSFWSQGGPICEREAIAARRHSGGTWYAMRSADLGDGEGARWSLFRWISMNKQKQIRFTGPTELVARLRCYVASRMGDEIDVPEELV